ncbi:hypothetical protein HNP84_004509 [Thermocatellispora tengchongensis]|uniref:Acetoacetate decarboxylase n=1 Tax=Thermocatellispora tengchongensis TaxID=1073253 RepID=A0A840PFG1_9ACTN|nr:acetoacetate decarboxylase family protein [Thermocatellispora tengchongensis]MBB5134775.1 hypothetical protein [Thermocatellispora tengchongensis]
MGRHLIQGREIATPVRVRDATACCATWLVRADAARAVIAYSGLDVTEALPGKALCALLFVSYADSDLGAYHEFGVAFMVRPPGSPAPPPRGLLSGLTDVRRAGTALFVHWLPVDQTFTLEAGRGIWGLPKELAEIDLRLSSPYKRCLVRKDGRTVLDLLLKPGVPLALPPRTAEIALDAYAHRDGRLHRTPWTMTLRTLRTRPGGALIRLGNHPVAKELSELGLPKHALLTATAPHVSLTIEEPVPLPGDGPSAP